MTSDSGTVPVPPAAAQDAASAATAPLPDTIQPADAAPLEAVQAPVAPRAASAKPARSNGRAGAGTIVLAVGLIVAVGGVAFAVGRVTAPAAPAAATTRSAGGAYGGPLGVNGQPTGSFVPGADGFRAFGGAVGGLTGTVAAITADTLTIQVGGTSGRTIEIPLSSSTAFHAETPATAADVSVGAEVTVRTERTATQSGQQGGQGPGAGGPPDLTIGTATDVTIVAPTGQ